MSFSISQMASSRASLVFSLCTNTLADDIDRHDSYGVCAASLTQRRPRPSRLSLVSTSSFSSDEPLEDNSAWFDKTPRRCHFILDDNAIPDGRTSVASFEATSQWFDEFEPAASRPDDSISLDTSSSCLDSEESNTPIPSDSEDTESLRTVESDPHLILDEQLLRSPIDSFEAMCWDATEASFIKPKTPLDWNPKLAELRLSRLYGGQAQAYEEHHSTESDHLANLTLPRMRFTQGPQPKPVCTALLLNSQALPYLAPVSSKAAKILDLPCDMAIIPTLLDMPTFSLPQTRLCGATCKNFAGKWKKAVQSLRPL